MAKMTPLSLQKWNPSLKENMVLLDWPLLKTRRMIQMNSTQSSIKCLEQLPSSRLCEIIRQNGPDILSGNSATGLSQDSVCHVVNAKVVSTKPSSNDLLFEWEVSLWHVVVDCLVKVKHSHGRDIGCQCKDMFIGCMAFRFWNVRCCQVSDVGNSLSSI